MIQMVGYRIWLIIDSYPQAAKYFGNINVFSAVLRIAAYLMSGRIWEDINKKLCGQNS